jgi:hypothetical protein
MNNGSLKYFDSPPHSYWMASTSETNYPQLTEDITIDTVVIGGGMAGILCFNLLFKFLACACSSFQLLKLVVPFLDVCLQLFLCLCHFVVLVLRYEVLWQLLVDVGNRAIQLIFRDSGFFEYFF